MLPTRENMDIVAKEEWKTPGLRRYLYINIVGAVMEMFNSNSASSFNFFLSQTWKWKKKFTNKFLLSTTFQNLFYTYKISHIPITVPLCIKVNASLEGKHRPLSHSN